ncbi:hypothetical protein Fmac_013179 [Flemingia macrophylla]|uniref:BHLH domain-containing protein n=1 Tax=Flemingia macrophylla TaxID=520843 RepID=A0ABD1MTB6_9FABA
MAIFMGCKKGEIELGFSNLPQVDIQTALKNLFPDQDFNVHSQSTPYQINPHSSSSSFRSLPSGTPDQCSSLGVVPTQTRRYQLAQVIPSFFPTPEGEHEAIVRALNRVISSPNSSSTSEQHQPHQILPNSDTAFTRYTPVIITTPHMGSNFHSQNLQNRLSAFFKNLNFMRMGQHDIIQEARPVSAQRHHLHMISERRRREKLNESFQELIALLPAGTKKNKASILTTAKDTMRSLMDEIEKLNVRNQQLMKTVLTAKEGSSSSSEEQEGSSSNERLNVRVSHEPECSSSEERMVKLQVTMRGESCQVDVLIRLLEFLKGVQNVNLTSMVANHITGDTAINQLTFRLRIVKMGIDE